MTIKHKLACGLLILFSLITLFAPVAQAQFDDESMVPEEDELVGTLNFELEEIYEPYFEFVEKLENSTNQEPIIQGFDTNIISWKSKFQESRSVYSKYTTHSNFEIAQIAQTALKGADLGIIATEKYHSALYASSDTESDTLFDEGDQTFFQAVEYHDQAVDLYNDYSGASSAYGTRNWLIFFSITSVVFSIFLFFKSRRKSLFQAEIIRSSVYKNLFSSSLWMAGGLIVTTVGYTYALQEGGTYYIFYGAILVGGWQLLKGLYEYFTRGRSVLNKLAIMEKHSAIKSLYEEPVSDTKLVHTKKCKKCRTEQSINNVVCSSCGENLL